MGAISGVGGAVDGVACVRKWSISSTADLKAFACSATDGATSRVPGNTDWSGSYDAYGPLPAHFPGESFTFTGDMGNGKGATGDAMVDQTEINWDIEGAEVISHTVAFSSNGALTLGVSVAADATIAAPYASVGTMVSIFAPGATYVPGTDDIDDVKNMTLTMTAANPTYADSATGGVVKRGVGNIDLSGSYEINVDDPTAIIVPNAIHAIRFWVDATEYWEILCGIFGDASNFEVDREGPSIVSCQQNFSLQAYYDVATVWTKGAITKPGGGNVWP